MQLEMHCEIVHFEILKKLMQFEKNISRPFFKIFYKTQISFVTKLLKTGLKYMSYYEIYIMLFMHNRYVA